jgi:hypothetical protein
MGNILKEVLHRRAPHSGDPIEVVQRIFNLSGYRRIIALKCFHHTILRSRWHPTKNQSRNPCTIDLFILGHTLYDAAKRGEVSTT